MSFAAGYFPEPHAGLLVATTEAEALALYEANAKTHGKPVQVAPDRWHVHPVIAQVRRMTVEEYMAMKNLGPVSAPPTPGSAAKAAKLKAEDKPRIDERVKKQAEKRRAEAEKAAEEERRRAAQGSLF